MNDAAKKIRMLAGQGYCCSQIMVKTGLDAKQEDNPQLLDAVAGLCNGIHFGLCCGVLTGAACLLSLYDKKNATMFMIPQLADWFERTYTQSFKGINCEDILDQNPMNKLIRCPKIMEETFEKCRELLEEYGHDI
jgi:hypothetical protein